MKKTRLYQAITLSALCALSFAAAADKPNIVLPLADEPVFSSGLLLSGRSNDRQLRLQLSRWVKSGRLFQLRRGLYALAPPWRKTEPHPFLIANRLRRGSYVSLQSALAWHGIIPEHAPVVTSVGAGRPATARTRLGSFQFRHLADALRFGYARIEVASPRLPGPRVSASLRIGSPSGRGCLHALGLCRRYRPALSVFHPPLFRS